jgi:hypothetical protein
LRDGKSAKFIARDLGVTEAEAATILYREANFMDQAELDNPRKRGQWHTFTPEDTAKELGLM